MHFFLPGLKLIDRSLEQFSQYIDGNYHEQDNSVINVMS